MHRNRALNGDIVVCEMLPTQTANKECEKSFAESPNSPNIQQNEQPITPKNLAAASELKENISKVTEKEVQCVDADLAASREVRGAKTLGPKNRKKPKKLMENVSNLNLGAELQDKSGLKTPSTMAENVTIVNTLFFFNVLEDNNLETYCFL